jgi:hypothetical protein
MSMYPSGPQTEPGVTNPGPPVYGGPSQPTTAAAAPPPGRNGLSIAGFILAIFLWPIGFILSVIALIQASRRGQKGKGLAIAGILISLILMVGAGVIVSKFGANAATIADPGCTTGKSAILDNADKLDGADVNATKAAFQTTIDQLNAAAGKAKHDNVRNTLKALGDDYSKIYQGALTGTAPDQALQDKLTADADALDKLCTLGGGK